MNTHRPLVSIITVCYNAARQIEASIRSVVEQDHTLFEYILIDGQSSDGTVDMIRQYESQIKYWISEPDKGIYDAMNKGIDAANGQWLFFLGSDDFLKPHILTAFAAMADEQYDLIYGDVELSNGRTFHSFVGTKTLFYNTVHHQGAFYNRRVFTHFRYDTGLRIMSDYELNFRLYAHKNRLLRFPQVVAHCSAEGVSSLFWRPLTEIRQIQRKCSPNRWTAYTLNTLISVYYYGIYLKLLLKKHVLGRPVPSDV
ncbi:glycosyltransferase family 2 protein [Larkinella bovis]|uniref:Glycosyltransferase family 2 protein n=1 Tax=Larkinella bovis TaxID=683041 RepID=A0ABW0IKV2_9BACT